MKPFHAVGLDYSTGNIVLVNKFGWCEIPYKRRQFLFTDSFFILKQPGELKAVASAPGNIFVLDSSTNTIRGNKKEYKINQKIKHPVGMAYHKGNIYVIDSYKDTIIKIILRDAVAEVVDFYYSPRGIFGLASDGAYLYASQRNKILKYDDHMRIISEYKIKEFIQGLTFLGNGEFLGVSETKREIYRIKL